MMKHLWKIRLVGILVSAAGCIPLSLEALGDMDPVKLSLYGLWIGLGLIVGTVCTLLETLPRE